MQRKPLEISFSVVPREEEHLNANSSVKSQKTVQFDLREEPNTASTIAARNILTTTPDPSDDEENKERNGESKVVPSSEMDVDKEDTVPMNNSLLQNNVPEVSVNS